MSNFSTTQWLAESQATVDAVTIDADEQQAYIELHANNGEVKRIHTHAHDGTDDSKQQAISRLKATQSQTLAQLKKLGYLTPIRELKANNLITVNDAQPPSPARDTIEAYMVRGGKISISAVAKLLVASAIITVKIVTRAANQVEIIGDVADGKPGEVITSKAAKHAAKSTLKTALPEMYAYAARAQKSISINENLDKFERSLTEPNSKEANALISLVAAMEPRIAKMLKVNSKVVIALSIRDLCEGTNANGIGELLQSKALVPNCSSKVDEYIANAQFLGGILHHARECGALSTNNEGTALAQDAIDVARLQAQYKQSGKEDKALEIELEAACDQKLKRIPEIPSIKVLDEWYATVGKDLLNTPIHVEKTNAHRYGRPVPIRDEVEVREKILQSNNPTQHLSDDQVKGCGPQH